MVSRSLGGNIGIFSKTRRLSRIGWLETARDQWLAHARQPDRRSQYPSCQTKPFRHGRAQRRREHPASAVSDRLPEVNLETKDDVPSIATGAPLDIHRADPETG